MMAMMFKYFIFLFKITFVGALSAIKTDDSDDNDLELKNQLMVIRCEW